MIEGIKLTVIGMGFVFVFLSFLWAIMVLLANSLAHKTNLEMQQNENVAKDRASKDDELKVVITTAIHAHRKKYQRI